MSTGWSEKTIAWAIASQIFNRKSIVMVPNCNWAGSESDLLVVTTDLRLIDVEVKISRSDLRADRKKDKWFHHWDYRIDGPWQGHDAPDNRRKREWPNKCWKHYYALPADIWVDSLLDDIPANSGVLALKKNDDGYVSVRCLRRAKPCRDADRLTPSAAVDVARLANLRMWAALKKLGEVHS